MGAGGDFLPGERGQRLVKLTEGNTFIVKESPDGLRSSKGGLPGADNIFNRTAERVCGCFEDLKVSNMSKSAAGMVSQPGRNVWAKTGLNRSLLDQGWYEMRRQPEYKQLRHGGQVLAVPPAYTSQRCACCGHTAKENRLSQSKFKCQACGYTANADVNGARNILAAGLVVLACGGMVQSGRPLKQEPTEMTHTTA